jgi:hypothetical protein
MALITQNGWTITVDGHQTEDCGIAGRLISIESPAIDAAGNAPPFDADKIKIIVPLGPCAERTLHA